MSIASTYEWLEQASSVRELPSFLLPYFKGASKADAAAIVSHLQIHGLFRSWTDGERTMKLT